LEGGILGRVDDMVVVRGVNVYPSAIEDIMRRFGEIAEYQVQISKPGALTELKIIVEPAKEANNAESLAARLEKALFNAFTLRVPVSVVEAGTLPRFDLKANRWLKS
jgi:phenylacetate-CoA ligase